MSYAVIAMDIWHILKIAAGISGILVGIFVKEFRPIGWTTRLIWGGSENARIPRPIAAAFYLILGIVVLFWGLFR